MGFGVEGFDGFEIGEHFAAAEGLGAHGFAEGAFVVDEEGGLDLGGAEEFLGFGEDFGTFELDLGGFEFGGGADLGDIAVAFGGDGGDDLLGLLGDFASFLFDEFGFDVEFGEFFGGFLEGLVGEVLFAGDADGADGFQDVQRDLDVADDRVVDDDPFGGEAAFEFPFEVALKSFAAFAHDEILGAVAGTFEARGGEDLRHDDLLDDLWEVAVEEVDFGDVFGHEFEFDGHVDGDFEAVAGGEFDGAADAEDLGGGGKGDSVAARSVGDSGGGGESFFAEAEGTAVVAFGLVGGGGFFHTEQRAAELLARGLRLYAGGVL